MAGSASGAARLAGRVARLGTETAFAVSAEAAAHAAGGNTVYPLHLGDMNIPTPANIVEAAAKAIADGRTGYCSNYGVPELREALAADLNRSHGTSYRAENISVQPGGKPVIPKFILALMNPGDEVLYPSPGYPIYESPIEFHGGRAVPYGYTEGDDSFRLRLDEIAREHDLFVLCDEAYFDIRYEGASRSLASLPGMEERCLVLYTFSKKFAMTGWRLGACAGPKWLIDVVGKFSVNDESCSNHFVQFAALEALRGDQSGARAILKTLKARRDRCVDLLNAMEGVRCFRPNATFYLFPNVTGAMRNKDFSDYEEFRRSALRETGVSFCTRAHFGRPLPAETERYIRFAYSGIDVDRIEEGLGRLKAYLES